MRMNKDILSEILKHIYSPRSFYNIALVCRDWRQVCLKVPKLRFCRYKYYSGIFEHVLPNGIKHGTNPGNYGQVGLVTYSGDVIRVVLDVYDAGKVIKEFRYYRHIHRKSLCCGGDLCTNRGADFYITDENIQIDYNDQVTLSFRPFSSIGSNCVIGLQPPMTHEIKHIDNYSGLNFSNYILENINLTISDRYSIYIDFVSGPLLKTTYWDNTVTWTEMRWRSFGNYKI